MSEDEFAHIVGYLVQDIVVNEHMPEEEKQPTKFFVEKYYNKLRLQSKWKPSKEQIKALNEVMNHAADSEKPHWNDYIYNVLKDLIKQLKKL